MDKSEAVAALRRAASMNEQTADALVVAPQEAKKFDADAAILRALAAALREARPGQFYNEVSQLVPGWFIPAPRIEP